MLKGKNTVKNEQNSINSNQVVENQKFKIDTNDLEFSSDRYLKLDVIESLDDSIYKSKFSKNNLGFIRKHRKVQIFEKQNIVTEEIQKSIDPVYSDTKLISDHDSKPNIHVDDFETEYGAKLDLAMVYLDIGEIDFANKLLQEVKMFGTSEMVLKADFLLKS